VVGHAQRERRVLFDQEHGDAVGVELPDRGHDPRRELRCETERRLVEHEQSRPGGQRPADGQHLLLTAGQQQAALATAAGQLRKQVVHALERDPVPAPAGGRRRQAQVLLDGEGAEDSPSLRNLHDAAAERLLRPVPAQRLVVEPDLPAGDPAAVPAQVLAHRAQQGGLAGAVAADEGDDGVLRHGQGDVAKGDDGALIRDAQAADVQHGTLLNVRWCRWRRRCRGCAARCA
jgi:hypothetical protein